MLLCPLPPPPLFLTPPPPPTPVCLLSPSYNVRNVLLVTLE